MILTHGRPEHVHTYKALKKAGYTGPIVIVVDNEDSTADQYKAIYGNEVYVFDKTKESETTDACDNFQHREAIVYARNASYRIARELGYEYFIQLDDDYRYFEYRMGKNQTYCFYYLIKNLDSLLESLLTFFITSHATAIAIAQTGDFIGGKDSGICSPSWTLKRKCMNTWLCHVNKPLIFCGHMNEDCSQYVVQGRRGGIFLQISMLSIKQVDTQKAGGGMTDTYKNNGTYLKTFYTILQAPSCVKISRLGPVHPRIHHNIQFNNCASKIIREEFKKR